MGEKLMQLTKKVLVTLIVMIVSCFIIGIIVSLLTVDVAGFFAGIGTFFLELLFVSKYSVKRVVKNGLSTTAKVISCERKKTYDSIGAVTSDYYEVVYQISIDNTIVQHVEYSNERVSVDKIISVHYDYDKDEMVKEEDVIGDSVKNGYKFCAIFSIISYLIAIAIVIVLKLNLASILSNIVEKNFVYVIGPALSIIGFLLLIKPIKFRLNEPEMQKIDSELIEYVKQYDLSDEDSSYSYYPVYKYWYNGEYKEYKSSIGYSKLKEQIGSTYTLLMDNKGCVRERSELISRFFISIIFIITGISISIFSFCFS